MKSLKKLKKKAAALKIHHHDLGGLIKGLSSLSQYSFIRFHYPEDWTYVHQKTDEDYEIDTNIKVEHFSGQYGILKIFDLEDAEEEILTAKTLQALLKLSCLNLQKISAVHFHDHHFFVISEAIRVTFDAREVIEQRRSPFSEALCAYIMREIFRALRYLHNQLIVHRNLKGMNIFLSSDGSVRLGGMELAYLLSEATELIGTSQGSPYWMAPEVIEADDNQNFYNITCDVWSMGITLIELAEMDPPHHTINPLRAMTEITTSPSPVFYTKDSAKFSQDAKTFLSKCVTYDFHERPSAGDMCKDKWLETKSTPAIVEEVLQECFKTGNTHGKSIGDEPKLYTTAEMKALQEQQQKQRIEILRNISALKTTLKSAGLKKVDINPDNADSGAKKFHEYKVPLREEDQSLDKYSVKETNKKSFPRLSKDDGKVFEETLSKHSSSVSLGSTVPPTVQITSQPSSADSSSQEPADRTLFKKSVTFSASTKSGASVDEFKSGNESWLTPTTSSPIVVSVDVEDKPTPESTSYRSYSDRMAATATLKDHSVHSSLSSNAIRSKTTDTNSYLGRSSYEPTTSYQERSLSSNNKKQDVYHDPYKSIYESPNYQDYNYEYSDSSSSKGETTSTNRSRAPAYHDPYKSLFDDSYSYETSSGYQSSSRYSSSAGSKSYSEIEIKSRYQSKYEGKYGEKDKFARLRQTEGYESDA